MSFEQIKDNYEKKLWNINMVRVAVKKGVISKEQFEKITSQPY